MDQEKKRRIDGLFDAFSVVAEDVYLFVCDMKSDFSRWSKSAINFFGLPDEYMYEAGDIRENYIHPEDKEQYITCIKRIFAGEEEWSDMNFRVRARDGSYVTCIGKSIVLFEENGEPEYLIGSIKNYGINNYTDTVTGLRSLYGFFEDLRAMFWKEESGVIIQIGTTGFSSLNDVYGYTFGNKILQQFGIIVQKLFKNSGTVYRMDGTKLVVITNTLTTNQVADIYKTIQEKVSHNFKVEGERISLSLNAGLVVVDDFSITDKTVYSCLKYAYSESKNRKIGDLVIYRDMLSKDNRKSLEKLNKIRNSVSEECDGFYLCYQPIMHASTEKLKGMEALLRWKNKKYGSVPPNQFIPVLEQDTLFPKLGKWILKQAMTDGVRFLEKNPDIILNVNLSFSQMEKDGFIEEVMEIIEETGFPPKNLCLEITEKVRLLDMGLLKDIVSIFRARGIKIALDDFGTGYASLGILRELPVDSVKIDRDYVKDVEKSIADQSTVKFIADLANAFSAEVCVEGVETKEMKDFLKQYNISSLQGYYYSKPIPSDEFMNLNFMAC